ncbi:MAG: cytochrome c [Candidatus Tectomicrobia bacterium]|uniref:Cytochrome c n=1 Tax=Tectimicrobiota bacterium TaxID=2528274 RepID=A0A932FZJ3_UNCTE|nr:cytochrome c [Candidatus Tectomicrobia bacterium]
MSLRSLSTPARIVLASLCLATASLVLAQQGDAAKGKELYQEACIFCHGKSGKGDGPVAPRLRVKPQDHTNDKTMSALTDQHLFEAIQGGGTVFKKSPYMPPFGTMSNPTGRALSDQEIWDLVAYIRTLHRPPQSSNP